MDRQNTSPGGPGGMERNAMSAGPANTPEFGGTEPRRGTQSSGQTSETERALEETRDTVARTAGPVVAEKMQEAVEETSQRLEGTMGEQAKRTATAVQHDAQRMAKEKLGEVGDRVEGQANRVKDRAANRLEGAANRLDEMADRQTAGATGARAKAGEMAHRTADTLESTARYLRTNDLRELQHDLERMTREKPVQTLLVAVAAGWVLGKILR